MLAGEPQDIFLNYALALEYKSANQFMESEEQLLFCLKLNPEYIPAFYQLAELYVSMGKTEKAIDFYSKGLFLAKQQNNHKAVTEFSEALANLSD